MKMEAGVKTYFEWIKENMPEGSVIGVDENQIPASAFENRRNYLEKAGIKLVPAGSNLVDEVWGADKPPMSNEKVWHLAD